MNEKKKVGHFSIWIFVFVFVFILHLWSLMRYPAPHVDEAFLTSRAWSFVQTGHQYGMLDSGVIDAIPGNWTLNQWLITFIQAAVLRFFPQPELIQLRVLSLIFGLGLLGANFWLTRRLGGRKLALASTLLLALTRSFFHSAHLVRYDIMAAALGYLGLAFVINNHRNRFWHGLASGILIGLAIETHLNALIFIPAVGVFLLFEYGRKVFIQKSTWGVGAGLLIGASYYLILHVLPYPQTYIEVNSLLFGQTQQPPILTFDFGKIIKSFGDTAGLLLAGTGSLVFLAFIGIIYNARTKGKGKLALLLVSITLFIAGALVIPNKFAHYAILLAPAVTWLAGDVLVNLLSRPWRRSFKQYVETIFVWGCVAGMLALSLSQVVDNRYQEYLEVQAKINAVVQPGDIILGSQIYWLGLYDHPYFSWEVLFMYPRFNPGISLEGTIAHFKPDILIMDWGMDTTIVDYAKPGSWQAAYTLPRHEFFDYLATNSKLAADIPSSSYVQVRAYRFEVK